MFISTLTWRVWKLSSSANWGWRLGLPGGHLQVVAQTGTAPSTSCGVETGLQSGDIVKHWTALWHDVLVRPACEDFWEGVSECFSVFNWHQVVNLKIFIQNTDQSMNLYWIFDSLRLGWWSHWDRGTDRSHRTASHWRRSKPRLRTSSF